MDVRRASYARAQRLHASRTRRRWTGAAIVAAISVAVPTISGALNTGATAPSITAYIGMSNGVSAGYRSAAGSNTWTRVKTLDTPDAGSSAYPVLVDLDNSAARDMLVGETGGTVRAFHNAGSDNKPTWERAEAWDLGIDFGSTAAPAAIDIDRDGDRDVVVGNASGDVTGIQNTGSKTEPKWARNTKWDLKGVGGYAHPASADFNKDGDNDLVIGVRSDDLLTYLGTGDKSKPFAHNSAWDVTNDDFGGEPAPAAGDLDGDGKADLLVVDGSAHLQAALKNTGNGFGAMAAWDSELDAGSGSGGITFITGGGGGGGGGTTNPPTTSTPTTKPTTPTTSGPTPTTVGPGGNHGPAAKVAASPATGKAPLPVALDARASTDADGNPLSYAWDFGDGTTVAGARAAAAAAPADPAAAMVQVKKDYQAADAKRESGGQVASVPMYLKVLADANALTSSAATAPFSEKSTNNVGRLAKLYIARTGHDLGAIYLFRDVPPTTGCDRYQTSYLYFNDAARVAKSGGFPDWNTLSGNAGRITNSKGELTEHHCTIPELRPILDVTGGGGGGGDDDEPVGSPTMSHTYAKAGTYTAKVTVSDGTSTSIATVTITVNADTPPPGGGGGGSGGSNGPLQGFGSQTKGGAGGEVIHITEATDGAVRNAFKEAGSINGPKIISFDTMGPFTINSMISTSTANLTVEGNGATLYGGSGLSGGVAGMLEFRGHDVIVRNLRLRNAGDNLRAQGDTAYNIVFDHISSTGSHDDGISIGYGAHDVTVQYCFLAGNTRSLFIKYGKTDRITLHHNWIQKQWIRGPLASQSAFVDYRNNIIEDWQLWGVRYESSASGNVVNNLFGVSAYARQRWHKEANGMNVTSDQPVYVNGNTFEGAATPDFKATAVTELPAAPVATQSVDAMEPIVRAQAGAMPRDNVDKQYINMTDGWDIGKYSPIRFS